MNVRRSRLLALLVLGALGCSAGTEEPEGSGASEPSGGAGGETEETENEETEPDPGCQVQPAPPTTAPEPDACGGAFGACISCCQAAHPGGRAYLQSVIRECVCPSGACAAACADELCACPARPVTFASDCEACVNAAINDGGPCFPAVLSTCEADPDCAALDACFFGCQ